MKEFDRIVLLNDIPNKKLKKGDIGTIVMLHRKQISSGMTGFEVEFFTLDGSTLTVETLSENQIRPVKTNEVAHVREVA